MHEMKERVNMQVMLCNAVLCCAVHEAHLTASFCTSVDAQPDFYLQASTLDSPSVLPYEAVKVSVIAHSLSLRIVRNHMSDSTNKYSQAPRAMHIQRYLGLIHMTSMDMQNGRYMDMQNVKGLLAA